MTLGEREAGLDHAELQRLLERGARRELIDGELFIDGHHVPRGAVADLVVGPSRSRRQTYADHALAFDDGRGYELIDGERFAGSSRSLAHQRALGKLYVIMRWACGDDHETLLGPFEWYVDDGNIFQPDLVVARHDDFTQRNLVSPPTLVVEIASLSTRTRDWNLKLHAYARAGLPHYWVVDPDIPAILTYDLLTGRYVERHVVCCHERLDVRRPFPVVIHPTDLLTTR